MGRGVLEVQVFEEGAYYVTFNLQSHYADIPVSGIEEFQVMMITAKVTPTIGDVDMDGSITSVDALMALQSTVRKRELTETQKTLADVDFNQIVNSTDALIILKKATFKRIIK